MTTQLADRILETLAGQGGLYSAPRREIGTFTFVEPLFLFGGGAGAGSNPKALAIEGDIPRINRKALRTLPKALGEGELQESIRLAELLGLDGQGVDPADFDEGVDRRVRGWLDSASG